MGGEVREFAGLHRGQHEGYVGELALAEHGGAALAWTTVGASS